MDKASDLLFGRSVWFSNEVMNNFSGEAKKASFGDVVVSWDLEIDQETSGVAPVVESHMNFDSVMLCLYLGWVNDDLW